ncbi:MAG: signal peptide peptidase SppA [Spirochaeta sp.]
MQFLRLDLNGEYREIGSQVTGLNPAQVKSTFRMDHFYERTEWVLRKKSCTHVLVVRGPRFSAPPFGALEAIRECLVRMTKAGKQVVYYAAEFETADCYLASACTERVLHPLGAVSFRGLARSGVFFSRLLKKQGIEVEIVRRGRYKSAGDIFRNDHYDQWSQEQLQRILDGTVQHMRKVLSGAEGFGEERIDAMLKGKGYHADEALEAGIVHRLNSLQDVLAEWKEQKSKPLKPPKIRGRWGKGKHVALLVFEGGIIDGDSRREPMLGQMVGDEPFIKEIAQLRENKRVKAVVLRINSGGGSAVASDNIVRELERLNEKKPLIVSMGPVAGSGGYWIATAGRRLFAEHTTITGSIGVIGLYFQLQELLKRHGITTDAVRHGDMADIASALRAMTEKERSVIEERIEKLYQEFLTRAAHFRNSTPEKIHELAEGRIWTGDDAVTHGLIDEAGGLAAALAQAAAEIGEDRIRVMTGPHIKQPFLARMLAPKNSSMLIELAGAAAAIFTPGSTGGTAGMSGGYPTAAAADTVSGQLNTGPLSGISLAGQVRSCMLLHGRLLCADPLLLATFSGFSG